jgi:Nitrile hydratase, alpha chain
MNNQDKTSEEITPKLPLWSYQLQQDSKLAVKTRKDLEIHLITRALKNEEFKQELVANPKGAIEQELGVKLPEDLEIQVLEETENTLYLVLPCNPYEGIAEAELQSSLGMTYEDVAQWVLEQQRNALLDDESSVKLMARAWREEAFKQQLQINPIGAIEQYLGTNIQQEARDIQLQVLAETVKTLFIVLTKVSLPPERSIQADAEINMLLIRGSCGQRTCDNTADWYQG